MRGWTRARRTGRRRLFLRVNYLVSRVWAAAFAAMALADGAVTFDAGPAAVGSIAVSVVALAAAITFTLRYPAACRPAKAALPARP